MDLESIPESAEAHVAICVPTFRRPKSLERCLRSIEQLSLPFPTSVIVADNDAALREGSAICDKLVSTGFLLPLRVIMVADRGIAAARNALVSAALQNANIKLIAMIDDDELPSVNWLVELVRVQREYRADVVGGPVQRQFRRVIPDYLAAANQPNYRRLKTGKVDFIDATSNILFTSQLFVDRPGPWFDTRFSLTGGEDKDFLLILRKSGHLFAWARNAVVTEAFPSSRSTTGWMLQRAFRAGNTDMLLFLKHDLRFLRSCYEGIKIAGLLSISVITVAFFYWHPALRFTGLRLGARAIGKICAVFGVAYREYGSIIHGA